MTSLGLALLRVVLAAVFIAHGANVLFGAWSGVGVGHGGLSNTAAMLAALQLEPSFLLAVLLGGVQLVGGSLLVLGLFTRWAAAALIVPTGVALWRVNLAWGFFLNWTGAPGRGQGMEFSLVLIGALACLVLTGAGDVSLDGWRVTRAAARAAGRARLRSKM